MAQKKTVKQQGNIQYTREQKGHSILFAIFVGWVTLYILPIYWAISPNHYYHL